MSSNNTNLSSSTSDSAQALSATKSVSQSLESALKNLTVSGQQYFKARRSCRHPSKLQPSPSSVSSHSNASSLFRDDGFEDDLMSSTSEQTSSLIYQRHYRYSFHGQNVSHYAYQQGVIRRRGEDDDDYQSCESQSHTTASSNIDDCALSTTSSSILQHEQLQQQQQQRIVFDKISLADAKREYRKSLILEHKLQHHLYQNASHQNKIQALLLPPLPQLPNALVEISHQAGTQPSSPPTLACHNPPTKQLKCDDRTVNIIGQMPIKSPGYWDSNLSITQRVVTEIIETERAYVDDLEQIVTGYICYLRNMLKKQQRYQKQQQKQHHSASIHEICQTDQQHPPQQHQAEQKLVVPHLIVNQATDEDRKSMLVYDDELTSTTNEVDEYDIEESENDIAIKENVDIPAEKVTAHNIGQSDATIGSSSIDIKKLFSNLEDIYKFNKDLLFRLEECYLNPSSVAECFVENASGFEVYTHYCTMYPQVVSTLTDLMVNPASAQLLKERQSELNQSLPLGAYLLKPVQRILKYHILFQSLIKHTSDDDLVSEKDRQLISEASSVMTNIACHINIMKRRHEHSIRVQEVQGILSGWEGPDLTTLGELILEDSFKLCNRQKSSRHLFLFDSVLLITKKKRDGSLCYKSHIECSNLMLIENIEGQPLVFNTVPFDNPKALCAFQAKNLDKKRDWCLQMKEVIIKSFEVRIPVHVKDLLMSLTNSNTADTKLNSTSETSCTQIRTPNYLERKKLRQDKKK